MNTDSQSCAAEPIIVYSAPLIFPAAVSPIRDGAVAVYGGKIISVGTRTQVLRAISSTLVIPIPSRKAIAAPSKFVEFHTSGIIVPGLVNAHTHLQYTGMAELAKGRYIDFHDWAVAFNDVYNPIIERGNPPWREWALLGADALIKSGTTAVADIVTDPEAADVLQTKGLHGIAYWEVMNQTNEDWYDESAVNKLLSDITVIPKTPGAGVSPHAPYSLDTEPLRIIPDIARQHGYRIHIHLAESPVERYSADPIGEYRDWHEFRAKDFSKLRKGGYGASSVEYVDKLGILRPDCHIAHGVYATKYDREILRKRGVAVALCPTSNRVTGLDEPPIAKYLEEGNLIAVGTDSLSSTLSLDMMNDVAELAVLAKRQQYSSNDLHEKLFIAATLGGAAALGKNTGAERIGQLSAGAEADISFFDIDSGKGDMGTANAVAAFIESGAGKCMATVISGEVKYSRENTWE